MTDKEELGILRRKVEVLETVISVMAKELYEEDKTDLSEKEDPEALPTLLM